MSLRRLSRSVFVDPWTGMEVDPDNLPPLPVVEPGPVIRRKATPDELARFDGHALPVVDSIGLVPRPIRGRYTDAEKRERRVKSLRVAAVRGAEATARRHPRPTAQKHPDDVVIATVLEHRGNRSAAGRALGVSGQSLHRRIAFLKACGRLPDEVSGVLAGRKGGMR